MYGKSFLKSKRQTFEVADRINLYYTDNAELGKLIERFADTIKKSFGSIVSPLQDAVPHISSVNINGKDLTIGLEVVGW